jgi:LmbE family N-acetylglucosaminyl deacetylase
MVELESSTKTPTSATFPGMIAMTVPRPLPLLAATALAVLVEPAFAEAGPRPEMRAASLLAPAGAVAQTREPGVGTVEAGLLLRQLDGEKRVLMIGAHPDDEDTALLATLARKMGARTGYLSLSRGEGGQNLIGPELNEGLGLLRTGELISARSLDGGEQFFTRAFDFGFSKSAEETFRHWPEEELLRDVVRVVRTFRPHVILSIFSGTPRDGHGQHQAAGIVSHAAFEAAADPSRFPEQLEAGVEAWAPAKLYRLVRWNPEAATVSVETGSLDPLLGRSHFQVAMESRSRHRSQGFGIARPPGPRSGGAELALSRVEIPAAGEDGFFTAVDTSLAGIASAAGAPHEDRLLGEIEAYREAIHAAGDALHAAHPERASPHLARALAHVHTALPRAEAAPEGPYRTELIRVLESRAKRSAEALLAASSVVIDVRVDRNRIVPGEDVGVEVLVWNGGPLPAELDGLRLSLPKGWTVREVAISRANDEAGPQAFFAADPRTLADRLPSPETPVEVGPGDLRRWAFAVRVPADAPPSRPYFLRKPREGSLYGWPDDPELQGRALDPPLLSGEVSLRVGGSGPFTVERPGSHVGADRTTGEYRVPVFVVPALSVAVEPGIMAWPRGSGAGRTVTVRVTNLSGDAARGELELLPPDGWEVDPPGRPLDVGPGGGEATVRFTVRPEPGVEDGRAVLRAVARTGGREYAEAVTMVDYAHVDPAPLLEPSELHLSHFPVRVPDGLRVGYVMGSGDGGVQALRVLGVEVEALDAEAVRGGDLSRFDALVLGIRAYETRPDLVAANERILGFARAGGTVIVQYHRYEYPEGELAPFPLAIRRPHHRVTDPEATVTLLDPEHPALSRPNRITDADFEGWIQERGLYFLSEWDERYTPLLKMADPGEEPGRGSLVVARLGDGAYVYTGLALFRQLPRGVPGAYRLLANLVSLRGEDL